MSAPERFANFAAANLSRTRSAASQDIGLARKILDDPKLADCPLPWIATAQARAAHPDTASWADIATALGATKDQVTGYWRRLIRELGYAPRHPSELRRRAVTGRCELVRWGDGQCGNPAFWLVSVGSRQADAQLSCAQHLNRTCDVMQGAENRAGTVLHVTPLDAADLSLLRPAS